MMTINSPKMPPPSIPLDLYQRAAYETEQRHSKIMPELAFPLLGLFGETGTLLSALKKKQRDRASYDGYLDAVVEELGDVLWYLSDIASKKSIKLSQLAHKICGPTRAHTGLSIPKPWRFEHLRLKTRRKKSPESAAFEAALIDLASLVGLLINDFKIKKTERDHALLVGHLAKILHAVIRVADEAKIDLNKVAFLNLKKVHGRWPRRKVFPNLFDAGCDPWERLPRKMSMTILERKAGDRVFVIQQYNGVNIGSQINDQKMKEDDYRFHDAFHLAYMAILGWSPVLRGLFKLHRSKSPGEDSLRAVYTEEGISTLIFQRSLPLKFFKGLNSLDYSLLKLIPDLVKGYEVAKCEPWQWELAILEGFRIFRELRRHRGGIVSVDLKLRKINFSKLPAIST